MSILTRRPCFCDITFYELQQASSLATYDATNWRHPAGFEIARHNTLHVIKTAGKIAAHVEATDDQRQSASAPLDPMLVADLTIEALRFANDGGYDLRDAVETRMTQSRERAAGHQIRNKTHPRRSLPYVCALVEICVIGPKTLMAMIPTMPPSSKMVTGSMMDDSAPTAVSTSSS